MPNRFNAREILSERWRNWRGTRVPFTPIACFNEQRSDATRVPTVVPIPRQYDQRDADNIPTRLVRRDDLPPDAA